MTSELLVELTGRWLRAWLVPANGSPRPVYWSDRGPRLPLAITISGRTWQLGWAAWSLHRCTPHRAVTDFLPELGQGRTWYLANAPLQPRQVAALLAEALRPYCHQVCRIVALVPAYLETPGLQFLREAFEQMGLPAPGFIGQDLVWLLAGVAEGGSSGQICLVDVDDYAVVLSVARVQDGELTVQSRHVLRELGRRVWLERVFRAACELAIRDSRRDPSQSPEADQQLYEQIESHWHELTRQPWTCTVAATDLYCRLPLTPDLVMRSCAPIARHAAQTVAGAVRVVQDQATPLEIWLSARAQELPGLFRCLYEALQYSLVLRDIREESYQSAALAWRQQPELDGVYPLQVALASWQPGANPTT